ncbi:MAG: hypothetical protein IBJ11_08985 [Phycisphaerales bacterium]|nr:hypothetical protein [Phycisphaerales bacterium]
MGYAAKKTRPAWEDRFARPSADLLLEDCGKTKGKLLETAVERLRGMERVEEQLSWQGLPWRWTLTFTAPSDPTRAFAYVVPDPEKPKIALPLTTEMIAAMPLRRLTKYVRDGVEGARWVGSVAWATWEIESKGQLDEILDLVRRKHQFLTSAN